MKVALIMMFRDEADILGRCLDHWAKLGVDRFFLCDNGSVDDSGDIARKYDPNLITDTRTNWPGMEVINTLSRRAIASGYDTIFPVDADEFIHLGAYNSIREWLNAHYPPKTYYAAELRYLNILPDGAEHWQEPHRKVFGRLNPAWTISPGNHLCNGVKAEAENYVYYKHYSIRSYDQFRRKMINYMTAFHQIGGWQDHPHAKDYYVWKSKGEAFFEERYKQLTQWAQ
jgi:glycosyltransferase involved in cell wall biosynthesis